MTSAASTTQDKAPALAGYDPSDSAGECIYDAGRGQMSVDFFNECLQHTKGEKAHSYFGLAPWQDAIVRNLFGWLRPDGTRRYREAFIIVPRKNGKTTMCAGLALYFLYVDHEPGAQIYSAAADREQASLVFDQAKEMVQAESVLSNQLRVYRKAITDESRGASYKPISRDANTKHGYNAHAVIFDELHAQPNRELVDVLTTSFGSRRQPMIVHITTAGYDRDSICWEKYDYARKVRDGVIDDPSFLPVIFEAAEDDDWTDPAIWEKANPNLGVSLSREYLERECKRAQEIPAYENTFKRLHLNLWTEQEDRWFSMDTWDGCNGPVDITRLMHGGRECYAGLDLSSKVDLSALVLCFPMPDDEYWLLPFAWLPLDRAKSKDNKDTGDYRTWDRKGLMKLTEGNVVDYGEIAATVEQLGKDYRIKELAFDPWNAEHLTSRIEDEHGVTRVEFRQGYKSMSEPAKEFERLLLQGKIRHGGHPVMRWCASNVAIEQDPAGNIKPSKKKSKDRIDLIVAAIMALGRALANRDEGPSVYSERGFFD